MTDAVAPPDQWRGRLAGERTAGQATGPADRYVSAMALHDELGKPGLTGRIWQRQAPHGGHFACVKGQRDFLPGGQLGSISADT